MKHIHLNTTRQAALIFTLHLCLGLIFCFLVFPHLEGGISGLDPDGYGDAGKILWETGQFNSIEKAPFYPAFIAVVSALAGGYQVAAIQIAQSILSAITCLLLWAIFRKTLDNDRQAFVAGLVCAVYPLTIWYIPRLWTETFLTFAIALFTWTLLRLLRSPTTEAAILCGLALGFTVLSKGIALVFLPLSVFVLLLRLKSAGWRWAGIMATTALILILPWTYRNWRITGTLVPVHANSGYVFFLGNGLVRHGYAAPLSYEALNDLTQEDRLRLYQSLAVAPSDPLEIDGILGKAALEEILANPLFLMRKASLNSLFFWYLAGDRTKSILTGVIQFPIAALALYGIIRAVKQKARALELLIPVIGIMGMCIAFIAFARLSITILPYLIGLAVFGCWPAAIRVGDYFRQTFAGQQAV